MDFKTLLERIAGRPVVLDENTMFSNLRQFLERNHVPWRSFRKGVTDEDIARNLRPNEVVITADKRFAYMLQERAILVPLAKSHLAQIEHLMKTIGRSNRGGSMWADISTCPICTMNHSNLKELTFWDADHMVRHTKNPHIHIKSR